MPGTGVPGGGHRSRRPLGLEQAEAGNADANRAKGLARVRPRRGRPRRQESARAVVGRPVPRLVEARHLDAPSRVRGAAEATVSAIQPDVADAVEEPEAAGGERTGCDAAPEAEVGVRAVGEVQPEVGVHVADESGAVETAGGRVAAPAVRDAE